MNFSKAVKILEAPGKIPGCSPCRNIDDCISDLRAQVAANKKGIDLTTDLIEQYGVAVVQAYMSHIQNNAEITVRKLLRDMTFKLNNSVMEATDFMDDGSAISLKVTIDQEAGSAVFDFTGTSCEVYANLNAPTAVTTAAVLYCIRCLIDDDIPLNQGCLKPIRITVPEGSLLNPSSNAAVVGGNVLTSQRIVDVILKCFKVCAASQGCMNNVSFGDTSFGYYETIAGGSGAGPNFPGCDGIQTHMTNTRITDPEILERRYPVVLIQFKIRKGSGGAGRFKGGDGLTREY
ncbi:unnamed protein product, partial [Soboliphyme baturini]|uniref:Hydantoinase_B domain-containing protein n=1 Tax=Soboliphyme baturini TaxID=241478 RepID=A0A183J5A7_9BILA